MTVRKILRRATVPVVLAASLTPFFAPEALAFPYHRRVGVTDVYAERPIPAAITGVLARSDALLRSSAIYDPDAYGRRIFLTDGGWRWRLLSFQTPHAFAQTRPVTEPIVVNNSDVARDLVSTGAPIAGTRSLSGVIAHERTHGLIRHRFGLVADMRFPAWLREGYCDYVAGGGSLSDAEAKALEAQGRWAPALLYYHGRQRVAATLHANGGSVDALFDAAR
jgi:hypothetical protein